MLLQRLRKRMQLCYSLSMSLVLPLLFCSKPSPLLLLQLLLQRVFCSSHYLLLLLA